MVVAERMQDSITSWSHFLMYSLAPSCYHFRFPPRDSRSFVFFMRTLRSHNKSLPIQAYPYKVYKGVKMIKSKCSFSLGYPPNCAPHHSIHPRPKETMRWRIDCKAHTSHMSNFLSLFFQVIHCGMCSGPTKSKLN